MYTSYQGISPFDIHFVNAVEPLLLENKVRKIIKYFSYLSVAAEFILIVRLKCYSAG